MFFRRGLGVKILILLIIATGGLCYRYVCMCDHIFKKYDHELAVCAIFKNEAPYLKEWIDYHHNILGVTHFYLYDNESSDDYNTVLDPYIYDGLVEVIPWSCSEEHAIDLPEICPIYWTRYQLGAYTDCCKNRALGKVRWLAVHDIDEYIVPVEGTEFLRKLLKDSSRPSITKFLKNPFSSQRLVGCLKFNWVIFGTSNIWDLQENQSLTDVLIWRAPDDFFWHKNTKCIYRPEAVEVCCTHNAYLSKGKYKSKHIPLSQCRVNHYFTGTEKRFTEKRSIHVEQYRELSEIFHSINDYTIIELKKKTISSMKQ